LKPNSFMGSPCPWRSFVSPLSLGFCSSFLLMIFACGKSDDSESDGDAPAPTPSAKPTAKPAAPSPTPVVDSKSTGFWVASASSRVVARYDFNGVLKTPIIDLKAALGSTGGVTALKFLDPTNLLVFFDPGTTATSESIALVDARKGVVKSKSWFSDATNLNQVTTPNLITDLIPSTVLVPTGDKVIRVLYDTALIPSSTVSVFMSKTSVLGCPFSKIEYLQTHSISGAKVLVMLSSGDEKRINILNLTAGVPKCVTSLLYSDTGQPAAATDTPVNAIRMADGRLYVLYQSDTNPKIVSYSFDGKTLSGAKLVYEDANILGTKPRGLFSRSNLRMLVGNTEDDKLFEISTAGVFTGFYVDNSFVQDIAVIEGQ
jgi:hypothetical protein